MKTSSFFFIGVPFSLFFFSGCTVFNNTPIPQEKTDKTPAVRTDLTTQTIVNKEGKEVIVYMGDTQVVKNKEATIRTAQIFKIVENSTLTIEKEQTTVTDFIKDSTITIENGAVLKVKYIKNSKIIVKKGGDLQVSERMKNTEVLLKKGMFSVKPMKIDELSKIIEE